MNEIKLRKILNRLIKLTKKYDIDKIKEVLSNQEDIHIKGVILEYYLRELYTGNGYCAEVVGGADDGKVDLIIYTNKYTKDVSVCIQVKNHSRSLNRTNALKEFNTFLVKGALKYKCDKYMIISVQGFTTPAKRLEVQNVTLCGWEYIQQLIKGYNPGVSKKSGRLLSICDKHFLKIFNQLVEYKNRTGHCIVPYSCCGEFAKLSQDVSELRMKKRRGELEVEKVSLLDSIGFCWEPLQKIWNESYLQLKEYWEKHGHTKIRNGQGPTTRNWARVQVTKFLNHELSAMQINKLKEINFFEDWIPAI
ncbi:Helicase associated domain protein [uncultured Clostridium sp.]|uniref:Helicase associated domain protein n=1 Tax=uncultured Clostridium sp. TaxID=59620 RepID=UPI0028E9EBE1|nr:Helicase associated domain protein [uncultured Clostridium sp.]